MTSVQAGAVTSIDPYVFVVRRFFLDLLTRDEHGWGEDEDSESHESRPLSLFLAGIDPKGVELTSDVLRFFEELGFCTFEAGEEERRAWIERNGKPEAAVSAMERAVRQLHWDLVIKGALRTEKTRFFGELPYIPDCVVKVTEWFVALGFPSMLVTAEGLPEPRWLPGMGG
ncbi:hypothetical protein [Streptomyces aureoversilis]|uniref:Uncharacterized protein n=1 Tax=Streptomyces aureoversilis TaxID=67277 RepID=A0ABW0A5J6_9ACTN